MGALFQLFRQEFTDTDSIVVTHNSDTLVTSARVLINDIVMNNLIESVVPSVSDPRNELTVTLTSVQTGVIQLVSTGLAPTPEVVQPKPFTLQYTSAISVPDGGTGFLWAGEVLSSNAGELLPGGAASTLVSLAVSVNNADASRDYRFDFLSDPAGAPAIIGSVALPSGSTTATATFSTAIAAGTVVGAKIVRTAGDGVSTFTAEILTVEISQP